MNITREQYNQMIAALEAAREGKKVEISQCGMNKWVSTDHPIWNFDLFDYRPAPEPKLPRWVAWDSEDIPVGALLRKPDVTFGSIATSTILCARGVWVHFVNPLNAGLDSMMSHKLLEQGYEHSLDQGKTWQPCGTLVKEEE